jgi:hypothetical protein
MQMYHKHDILTAQQQVTDPNPLFELARTSRDLKVSPNTVSLCTVYQHKRITGNQFF